MSQKLQLGAKFLYRCPRTASRLNSACRIAFAEKGVIEVPKEKWKFDCIREFYSRNVSIDPDEIVTHGQIANKTIKALLRRLEGASFKQMEPLKLSLGLLIIARRYHPYVIC